MPESSPSKVSVKPSKSLWQRLTGTEDLSPETQQAINIVKKENPNLSNIQPYGLLSRILMGQAQGYTSPTGSIYLNPEQLQGMSPQDIADTITHEQVHSDQVKSRGLLQTLFNEIKGSSEPYGQKPDELAAFQAERKRRARLGRTGEVAVYPSFTNPGQFSVNSNTYLPRDK